MNEYVFSAFTLDEPVAFCGVEPLHCTLFFHAAICPYWIEIAICGDGNGGYARRSAVTPLAARSKVTALVDLAILVGITTTNCKANIALFGRVVTKKPVGGQFYERATLRRSVGRYEEPP
jgi:hypothetical protein